ncbi:MAG TPA: DUF503 domain-containing protein [Longimicrobiales bacterium]|nr:DUF503 domain-containing protein [Longimicrobiales bacterium]
MHLAVQTFQLSLPACGSRKEKRMVVKSLRQRLRNRFNVSVAETGALEVLVRAELTVAVLGPDRAAVESVLDRVDRFVESERRVLISSVRREFR